MSADPYTMERRLCDDDGMVSEQPCTDENLFAPGLTYLGQINNLRAHGGHSPVAEPFTCTGSAHLAGEHIRCTSPAHTGSVFPNGVPPCSWCGVPTLHICSDAAR